MRQRLGRVALSAAAGVVWLFFIVGGTNQGSVSPLVVALAGGALVLLVVAAVRRRRPMVVDGWTPAVAVSYAPGAPRPASSAAAVSGALARVETRELLTSPALGLGLGLSFLVLYTFGYEWGGDFGGDLVAAIEMTPLLTHPLAGMVVLAAFRARTRGRRDGTEELFESCPTSQGGRTVAHLVTAAAPGALGIALAAGLAALVASGIATPYGEVGARQAAAMLGSGMLCVGAVFLGVTLARWLPWTLVPVVAVVAVGVATATLATQSTRTTEPLRQLSTVLVDPELDLRLTAPHWLAHHLWIVSLAAIVAVLGLLRDHRRPQVLAAGGVAVAVAVASGVLATRPIDDADAVRIAALLDPANLACDDVSGFAVCTFPHDDEVRGELAGVVRSVAERVPAGTLDGYRIHPMTTDLDWNNLDPEVRALVDEPPRSDTAVVPIEFSSHPLALEAAQLWTGLAAVGALDGRAQGSTHVIRGQARGVIALWLGTRDHSAKVQRQITSQGEQGTAQESRPWPDSCHAGPTPVQWAATDVVAARQMLALPEGEVAAVLAAEWARLVDRATTTDDLMELLGLEPVGLQGSTPSPSEC